MRGLQSDQRASAPKFAWRRRATRLTRLRKNRRDRGASGTSIVFRKDLSTMQWDFASWTMLRRHPRPRAYRGQTSKRCLLNQQLRDRQVGGVLNHLASTYAHHHRSARSSVFPAHPNSAARVCACQHIRSPWAPVGGPRVSRAKVLQDRTNGSVPGTFGILSDTQRIGDGQPLQKRILSASVPGVAFALLAHLLDQPAKEALCGPKILRAAATHDLGESSSATLPTSAGS